MRGGHSAPPWLRSSELEIEPSGLIQEDLKKWKRVAPHLEAGVIDRADLEVTFLNENIESGRGILRLDALDRFPPRVGRTGKDEVEVEFVATRHDRTADMSIEFEHE
jgi:hypothetical protein